MEKILNAIVLLTVSTFVSVASAQDKPTHIPFEAAARTVWGDKTTGKVIDWAYVSNDKMLQLVFGMAPGEVFRHSDKFFTLFLADEVYYVLSGTLLLNNPETGEVHRARPGEAIFFRAGTWHHGFSYGPEPLRVLEFFAPRGTAGGAGGVYARTRPDLKVFKQRQDEWIGKWPMEQSKAVGSFTMRVVREPDILWRLEGDEQPVLVGILASTEKLTVGKVFLRPGQESELMRHPGVKGLYLVEGRLQVRLPETANHAFYDLKAGDGFYFPEETAHQLYNPADQPATIVFGVASRYLSQDKQ